MVWLGYSWRLSHPLKNARSKRPLILFHQLVYHKALFIGASGLFKYVWLPGVFGWGVRQGWRNYRQGELPLGVVGRCLSPRRRASGLGSDCRSMTGRWMRAYVGWDVMRANYSSQDVDSGPFCNVHDARHVLWWIWWSQDGEGGINSNGV